MQLIRCIILLLYKAASSSQPDIIMCHAGLLAALIIILQMAYSIQYTVVANDYSLAATTPPLPPTPTSSIIYHLLSCIMYHVSCS
jgi:hypothetical protein